MKHFKYKLMASLFLATSINCYADATANVQDPFASMYQRQSRCVSNTYQYSITNTTSSTQTYHFHADLCPVGFNCKSIDKDITLNAGQTNADTLLIQMDVYYMSAGNYPISASVVISGESRLDIRRSGFIYVNG